MSVSYGFVVYLILVHFSPDCMTLKIANLDSKNALIRGCKMCRYVGQWMVYRTTPISCLVFLRGQVSIIIILARWTASRPVILAMMILG